jgi:hypothetical protein
MIFVYRPVYAARGNGGCTSYIRGRGIVNTAADGVTLDFSAGLTVSEILEHLGVRAYALWTRVTLECRSTPGLACGRTPGSSSKSRRSGFPSPRGSDCFLPASTALGKFYGPLAGRAPRL